jgi:hypothetical protein
MQSAGYSSSIRTGHFRTVLSGSFRANGQVRRRVAFYRATLRISGRRERGRVRLTNNDRWFFIQLYRWFHQSCRFSQSSDPRRSCVSIGLAFAATGVGSRAGWEGDRRLRQSCGY